MDLLGGDELGHGTFISVSLSVDDCLYSYKQISILVGLNHCGATRLPVPQAGFCKKSLVAVFNHALSLP